MPDARENEWETIPASQQTVNVESNPVGAAPMENKIGFKFWAANLTLVVASILIWNNIVEPAIDFFDPQFQKVSVEVDPEVKDLLEASLKNCRKGNFNRRGCKAIWAGVSIPQLTANGR